MMRQVSSRNQRSKGLRVKNVLQLCLLAAVCFWLLYQLKHSYNKKRALEERSLKASEKTVESQLEFLKLGRKDLSRGEENSSGNGIHDKEEGNEEVEEEEDDREIKQAMEDEEAGGDGDDGIDEQDQERDGEQEDQERADDDAENGEELTNEEDKDDRGEETEPSDDQDPEEDSSHKAREESYNRDDVSSAVRRENQEKNSDDEDGDAGEEVMENTEVKYVDADDMADGADDMADGADDASKTNSDLSAGAADASKDNIMGVVLEGSKTNRDDFPTVNGTVIEEKGSKFEFNNSEGSPSSNQRELQANSTTAYLTNNDVEAQANATSAVSIDQTETQTSSTVSDAIADSVPLWNETSGSDSVPKHSFMIEMENSERNKINLKNAVMEGLSERSNTTVGQEDAGERSSVSLSTRDNGDPIQGEFAESSHKMVAEEERDARIDLSTLPALQNEVKSMADEAAE